MRNFQLLFFAFLLSSSCALAQPLRNAGSNHGNRFEQLDYLMQDPNEYRTASGAPGPKYWQQRADYDINVDINEAENLLTGFETVTYTNNSPDVLTYIWLQIDENFHHPNSNNNYDKALHHESSHDGSSIETDGSKRVLEWVWCKYSFAYRRCWKSVEVYR